MSRIRTDLFPSYREAGYKIQTKDQSTAACLQSPDRGVGTPDDIKYYRKSYKEQSGTTILHYGVARDPMPQKTFTYGIPTQKSQGVNNIMKAGQKLGIGQFVNNLQQQKYQSAQKQPLGSTIDRKYNFPQQTNSKQFKFGLPTQKNKYDAKQTIYSGQNMLQVQPIRQMYLKSHQDYDPGQQKKRPYNWNVDPVDFRFGKIAKNIIHDQIKQIITPDSYSTKFPSTKLIKTNQNDFIDKKDVKLGKSANLGQKQFPPQHVFGVRIQGNQWNAGKCIRGEGTEFDVRQDDDLGKCTKLGSRNIPKDGDESRAFGIPTIRYDIKKPQKPSVADPNNYADETTAIQLLFPKQFNSYGIDDNDFDIARPKQQIYDIFVNIGFQFKGNIFQAIFQRSKVIHGTILDKVSCNSFKKAIYEMCG